MQLTDTHCHIHSTDYPVPIADVDTRCAEAGVTRLICVGTDADDSERAIRFVRDRPGSWAAIGLHPHEAKFGQEPLEKLRRLLKAARVGTTAPRPSTFSLGEATSARAQDVIESEKGGGAPQEQPNKQAPRLIPPLLQKDDKAPRGDEVTRDTLSLHPGSIASFREKGGSGALSSGGAPTEGATNKIVAISIATWVSEVNYIVLLIILPI